MISFGISVLYFCAGLFGLWIFVHACLWLLGAAARGAGHVIERAANDRRNLAITIGVGLAIGCLPGVLTLLGR
jgi:hypothetical protein